MKYKAVIFDLFGTLIPNYSEKEYRRIVMQMASILTASPEAFWQLWSDTFKESILGILPDSKAKIINICGKLGLNPTLDKIIQAEQVTLDGTTPGSSRSSFGSKIKRFKNWID